MWGITEASRKVTGIDDRVLPVTVIYDATRSMSLSPGLSVTSGLNALAHSIDSLWAPHTDPINQTLALEGIRALNGSLPLIRANPLDEGGRERALYGAYLSAVAFASAGFGMHHKICHVLGDSGIFLTPRLTPWCSRMFWHSTLPLSRMLPTELLWLSAPKTRWLASPRWARAPRWAISASQTRHQRGCSADPSRDPRVQSAARHGRKPHRPAYCRSRGSVTPSGLAYRAISQPANFAPAWYADSKKSSTAW